MPLDFDIALMIVGDIYILENIVRSPKCDQRSLWGQKMRITYCSKKKKWSLKLWSWRYGNKTKQEEGGTRNLLGALGREDDLRLGDENALKMYARQSDNLKSGWGKSEEKAQQGIFIGEVRNTPQWRGGKPNEPIFNAICMPLRFANRQTMMTAKWTASSGMPFESTLMDVSAAQFCLLEFSAKPLALWVPWFAPENWARIKGGLMYGPKKPQAHWAQGLDMIASSQGPSLIPHMGPFKQSNLKWLTCLLILIHAQSTVPREVVTMLGIIVSR